MVYASISGYYLGLAKFNSESYGPIVGKGLLLAAFAHVTYDTIITYVGFTGLTFVVFVVWYSALLYFVYRKIARYGDLYERAVESQALHASN